MGSPQKKKTTIFRKHSLRTRDDQVTKASELSMREALLPVCLVTLLFFLWVSRASAKRPRALPLLLILLLQGLAYGLLDTLNKHFQTLLGISRARSSGLQAA